MSLFFESPQPGKTYHIEVATALIRAEREHLFLQRAASPLAPHTWCIPGGKLEEGESAIKALIRELKEELSWKVGEEQVRFVKSCYVHHPAACYLLHLFDLSMKEKREVRLKYDEHENYRWVEPGEISSLDLLEGQRQALEYFVKDGVLSL